MQPAPLIARALRFVAARLDSPQPEESGVTRLSNRNAIVTDEDRELRNGHAASLVEPTTIGYALFRVHRDHGPWAELEFHAQVHSDAWPVLSSVMAHIVLAEDKVVR